MATLIEIPASSLVTLGSSSLTCGDDDSTLHSLGSLLSATGTTVTLSGGDTLILNAKAEELKTTKAYVQSLSEEERARMFELLDEQEEVITREEVKKFSLKK